MVAQVRVEGALDQGAGSGVNEKWLRSGCLLKVALTGLTGQRRATEEGRRVNGVMACV